jgi:ubiquitin-protein ligase
MYQISIIQSKRFAGEKRLLEKEPLDNMTAYQDESNPLIWYFYIKGQKDTPFNGGEYIGRIQHSPEYPAKPPKFFMLTPSGRFELEKEICLTISQHHPESWTSNWNIKTILIAFYSIFLDDKEVGASFIKTTDSEKKTFAMGSQAYNQKHLKGIYEKFNLKNIK